jgi:uncharacterized membrane protein
MRAFTIVAGTLFGLLVVAHLIRLVSEPHLARGPFFAVATVVAASLAVWALRLVRRAGGSKGPLAPAPRNPT